MIKKFFLHLFFFCFCSLPMYASWAQDSFNRMSLDQKIGQLFIVATLADQSSGLNDAPIVPMPYPVDRSYIEHLIKHYHIGGLIFLGSSTAREQVTMTRHYQALSAIPLLIAQDFEWGWGVAARLTDAMKFPCNMTLGALTTNDLIYHMGKEIGRQMKQLGVHMNFSPVVDVNNNPGNPVISDRSFGEDPVPVAEKGIALMQGLRDAGVMPCAKHFPGHGDTEVDSHHDLPRINHPMERLQEIELYPFKKMIEHGVPVIMLAHLELPAVEKESHLPTSLSYSTITNLLRHELGFEGLIVPDGLGMKGVLKYHQPGVLELKALLAGNDILLCPMDLPKAVELIKQAIVDGAITMAQLDAKVIKILQAKEMSRAYVPAPEFDHTMLHTSQAYALKKKLYAQAITLVRDKDQMIPIAPATRCITIGGSDHSLFATMLRDAGCVHQHVAADPTAQELEAVYQQSKTSDRVIVALFGMNKFKSKQFGIADTTIELLDKLQQNGTNIMLTIFGNPYSLSLFERIGSILVAYEDDRDAQEAAAMVLLGKLQAQGKLPVLKFLQR